MTKVVNVFCIVIAILAIACGSEIQKNDLENFGMKGKVKSVVTASYQAFDKFGEGTIGKAKPEMTIVRICNFDSLGNILVDKSAFIKNAKHKYTVLSNERGQWLKYLCYSDNDDSKIKFGSNYFYNDNGLLTKEVDVNNPSDITNYSYKFDKDGHMISKVGGDFCKETWEYQNGELVKYTDYYFTDEKREIYYKNGLEYKDVRGKNLYWLLSYDEHNRLSEAVEYKNGNVNRKQKFLYTSPECKKYNRIITYGNDGNVISDNQSDDYTYFVLDNDTITSFRNKDNKIVQIDFYSIMEANKEEDITYETESSDFAGYQFIYQNGKLVSLKDLESSKVYNYVDGVATITISKDGTITEFKYVRNEAISRIEKVDNKITYSYTEDGKDKKVITIIENGVTKRGEKVFENGKLIKTTDALTGITTTFSYNKYGLVSEEKLSDGTVKSYKYDYDQNNNWIRKIVYENKVSKRVLERSITYFQ